MNRCRHCHESPVSRPRGMCRVCYYTPGIRDLYPSARQIAVRTAGRPGGRALCRHCNQNLQTRARKLCVVCYENLEIRHLYPSQAACVRSKMPKCPECGVTIACADGKHIRCSTCARSPGEQAILRPLIAEYTRRAELGLPLFDPPLVERDTERPRPRSGLGFRCTYRADYKRLPA